MAFEAARKLLKLCESKGYDPEGATIERLWKNTTNTCPGDRDDDPMWCLAWYEKIDWEDFAPQSDGDRPAILFITGREEWHDHGELKKVVTAKGITKLIQ